MEKGTVKWFDNKKGYGFVAPTNGSKDVFVHITALQSSGLESLDEGQMISFTLEENAQGKVSATNIELA